MQRQVFFLVVAFLSASVLLTLPGCDVFGSEKPKADFANARGTIGIVRAFAGGTRYVIYSEQRERYCLEEEELSEKLKQDQTQVFFTGNVEEFPANERLNCTPLELIEIEKANS